MVKDRRFFTHIFAKDKESQKIFMLKFRITKPKIGYTLREEVWRLLLILKKVKDHVKRK